MIKFPKLLTTLLSVILLLSSTFAQTDKNRVDAYINSYKELAISEMLRTGVPASITLAQGILETAGGQSDLASIANNHFGIKCKSDWTGEHMFHDDDARNECFRKYPSAEDSYKDHSDFLRTRPMYAFLFKLDPTDYEGWAKGLKRAGYATNPTYAQQLVKIIVENNLQSYSLLAMQRKELGGNDLFATTGSIDNNLLASNANSNDDISEVNASQPVFLSRNKLQESSKKDKYSINSVFNINDAKVIYAKAGTSLLALANNYNVGLKKLLDFNDLEQGDILTSNQLIFLQKKSKKGSKDIHIVTENESLHDVAQEEGIQLSSLLEYNGLRKEVQLSAGEKLYLKYSAPSSPKSNLASNNYKLTSNAL